MKPDDQIPKFEFSLNVRFLDATPDTLFDSDEKEILCKCGNSVSRVIIGKEDFLAKCSNCWQNAEM